MTEHNLQSNDSISLTSVKNIMYDVFTIIHKSFSFLFNAVTNTRLLFLACCILGLLIGWSSYYVKPPYFKTDMIVQQNSLTRKAYHEIIKSLDDLIASKSYADFAAELKIKESWGAKVLSIEALSINNESLEKDTSTKVNQPFKISVKLKDNNIIKPLQNSLLAYLNENSYVTREKEGQKRIYKEKLLFIDQELKKLDSLKDTYNRTLGSMKMPTAFYNNTLNPAELYAHSFALAEHRERILEWFNNESQAVLLVDGFKTPANPQSVSMITFLSLGLTGGVLLGFIVALIGAIGKQLPPQR